MNKELKKKKYNLKPCPFCGLKKHLEVFDTKEGQFVNCSNHEYKATCSFFDELVCGPTKNTAYNAVRTWNKRPLGKQKIKYIHEVRLEKYSLYYRFRQFLKELNLIK